MWVLEGEMEKMSYRWRGRQAYEKDRRFVFASVVILSFLPFPKGFPPFHLLFWNRLSLEKGIAIGKKDFTGHHRRGGQSMLWYPLRQSIRFEEDERTSKALFERDAPHLYNEKDLKDLHYLPIVMTPRLFFCPSLCPPLPQPLPSLLPSNL